MTLKVITVIPYDHNWHVSGFHDFNDSDYISGNLEEICSYLKTNQNTVKKNKKLLKN